MNRQFFRLAGVAICALFASVGVWAQNLGSVAAGSNNHMNEAVSQQIAAIGAIKQSFSPAEQKLDSHLAFAILAAGKDPRVATFASAIAPVGASTPSAGPGPGARPGLTKPVLVNIFGTITTDTIDAVTAVKGVVESVSPTGRQMTAAVPLSGLATIAARPDVTRIGLPAHMHTNLSSRNGSGNGNNHTVGGERTNGPNANTGLVTSQGYVSHRAKVVVESMGITGAGVTVGVLSDSATQARIDALKASGDLPPTARFLPGQEGPSIADGGTDEGAAIMEIIHDMAPGADIIFATAFTSEESFADNIRALAAAGCKVIVDDVSYSDEGVFQDGIIAKAVNDVTALGVIYFSSAANSGSKTFGTSGTWEGDFLDGGDVTAPITSHDATGRVHNFGTAATPQNFDRLGAVTVDVTVSWSDPLDTASNDYDLFILNAAGTSILDFSVNRQNGGPNSEPIEEVFNDVTGYPTNARVVVVKFSGDARALHVDTFGNLLSINTQGSTHGHNAAANAVSMAAVYWGSAGQGTVPFVGGAANPDEPFSSDGPRKIFYNPDGSAITPGNFLFATNGGTTLQKPDFAAADGGSTVTPGFSPFFGTSAAGPHAAAIAALILQARPTYTVNQILTAMRASALDTMAAGPDRDSGYGIPMANTAVQYALTH